MWLMPTRRARSVMPGVLRARLSTRGGPGSRIPSPPSELRLRQRGLEQFDGVAGRVFEEDLLAAQSRHDVIAEGDILPAQPLDGAFDVRDLEREPVPASRLGSCPVGHRLAAAWAT